MSSRCEKTRSFVAYRAASVRERAARQREHLKLCGEALDIAAVLRAFP
jgi:hypothetical protein